MNAEGHNESDYELEGFGENMGETAVSPEDSARQELEDLIPAYSIGAVDPEESEFVQAHLAANPSAVRELASYAALHQILLHSAEPHEPSEQLGERLRSALRETGSTGAKRSTADWRDRLVLRKTRQLWGRWAFAAVVALLIVLNFAAAVRIRSLQEANRALALQLSNQREALALMTTDGGETATLPAADENSGASATVRWTYNSDVALVRAQGFPALEPGQAYQLWLIRDGERTSGGLFTVDADGAGTLVVHAPDAVAAFDAMGITPEPAEGSPGPTAPPVVVGPLPKG